MTFPFKDILGYVCGFVHVFCIVHISYCTNTLHVPLINEHLAIASKEYMFCSLASFAV